MTMVKEHFRAWKLAGLDNDAAIEAVDALVARVEGAEADRKVTKWAAVMAVALLIAVATKLFFA